MEPVSEAPLDDAPRDDAPRDDAPVRALLAGGLALPAMLVAHEVGLFERLATGPHGVAALAADLGLPPRSVDALVRLATAVGLLEGTVDEPRLTATARAFWLRDSATTFAGYLDLLVAAGDRYTVRGMREALRSGAPPADGLDPEARRAALARAMHDRGVVAARAWVRRIDLGSHCRLLDVGGGSGVHAMEAVRRFPGLAACVLDLAPVCAFAEARIAAAGLSDRVSVTAADYLGPTPFPEADVHLYAEVLHNRAPDDARRLVEKSWRALPPRGRILVHEMVLEDGGPSALAAAAAHLNMCLWTRAGRQPTRAGLVALLTDAGFVGVEVAPTGCGAFSLATGLRP